MAEARPLVSVVVTTYARERLADVLDLLESLKAQSYPQMEIVFVAGGEPDLGTAVAEFIHEQGIGRALVLSGDGKLGVSAARNLGIKHAQGDIVAFVDDDAIPYPDWAEEMVRTYLEDRDIIGVVGAAEPLWEDPFMNWFPKELYWIIGCTGWLGRETDRRQALNAPTVNASYRREALLAAGMFSSALGPHRVASRRRMRWAEGISEDTDLFLRVKRRTGKQVIFNPRVRVRHKVPKWKVGLWWVVRRSLGVGWSRRMLQRSYGHQDRTAVEPQQDLLRRIFTRLVPSISKGLFAQPAVAWRQLVVTVVALLSVAAGYLSFSSRNAPGARTEDRICPPNSAVSQRSSGGRP